MTPQRPFCQIKLPFLYLASALLGKKGLFLTSKSSKAPENFRFHLFSEIRKQNDDDSFLGPESFIHRVLDAYGV
jgi:hypothetical protein